MKCAPLTLVLTLLAALGTAVQAAPVYRWTTLAGRSPIGADDGPRADARFSNPHAIAYDLTGNLFVADTSNHTIRKITPAGAVSTFAGSAGQSGSADGTGAAARFNAPKGLAVDASGNLYIADTGNHTIRKITSAGVVTTLAGQAGSAGNVDGAAGAARFDAPDRLTVDSTGNVYLHNGGLRKIASGTVSTLTIPTTITDADSRTLTVRAEFGPAVDNLGNLYFPTETGMNSLYLPHAGQFLKRAPDGSTTVFRTAYFTADDSYSAYDLRLFSDRIFNDAAGNLFVAMEYRRSMNRTEVRGAQLLSDGTLNESTKLSFNDRLGIPAMPLAIAMTPTGELLYTLAKEHAIKSASGTFAGTALAGESVDASGGAARFTEASGLSIDSAGNLWLSETARRYHYEIPYGTDSATSRLQIRKITSSGAVSTTSLPAKFNAFNPPGTALAPLGIYADSTNTVSFAWFETAKNQSVVSQILSGGSVTDLNAVPGLALDPVVTGSGEHYLLSYGWNLNNNHYRVAQKDPSGTWSTFAGGSSSAITDGTGPSASFSLPSDLTVNQSGNLYLLDADNISQTNGVTTFDATIRRITSAGVVTSVGAKLTNQPSGLAVASNGNFFLTHATSHTITRIDSSGNSLVIGGVENWAGSSDGDNSAARFASPEKIIVDANDNIYVVDGFGTTVRKGEYLGEGPEITAHPQSQTVAANASVTFSVTASSPSSLTYQWKLNGQPIAGATAATLTISSALSANAGDYTVLVSNSAGGVTSDKATLTVNSTPVPDPNPIGGGSNPPPATGGSGGGGGSPSLFFLASLAAATAWRWRKRCGAVA